MYNLPDEAMDWSVLLFRHLVCLVFLPGNVCLDVVLMQSR